MLLQAPLRQSAIDVRRSLGSRRGVGEGISTLSLQKLFRVTVVTIPGSLSDARQRMGANIAIELTTLSAIAHHNNPLLAMLAMLVGGERGEHIFRAQPFRLPQLQPFCAARISRCRAVDR